MGHGGSQVAVGVGGTVAVWGFLRQMLPTQLTLINYVEKLISFQLCLVFACRASLAAGAAARQDLRPKTKFEIQKTR